VVRRALAPLLLLAALLTGCAGAPAEGPSVIVPGAPGEPAQVLPGQEAAERARPQPVSPADVVFVEGMIVHHRQAVEMAELAPQRAADPRVRSLAERIAVAQGVEISAFENWLAERAGELGEGHGAGHGGGHADGAVPHPGMATPEQIAALGATTGAEFDRAFLQLMIAHHEGALAMAEGQRLGGTDVLAQQMADDVTVEQTAEIQRMQALLA
jgi:uncharacterized protein (DUF305 family)